MLAHLTAWLYWDPPIEVFTIPYLERPVVWYGVFFVLGFFIGYFITVSLFSRYLTQQKIDPKSLPKIFAGAHTIKQASQLIADRLIWFVVIGTLLGARLGAVLFYDLSFFIDHPMEIFKVWKGGLASHGGVIGVVLSLYFFFRYTKKNLPSLTFLTLLDLISIPAAIAACFIRLGNFMNQEILGTPTNVPWAVIFGHPFDGSAPIPRHPVQLYEALAYLATFTILYLLWKKKANHLVPGTLFGLLLVLIFSSRFILEFWKENLDSSLFEIPFLQPGQLLSIPFILLGIYFVWPFKKNKLNTSDNSRNQQINT